MRSIFVRAARRAARSNTQTLVLTSFVLRSVGVGVGVFDDPFDGAVAPSDDPAVTCRIVELCGEERRGRAGRAVVLDELLQRFGGEERRVAGQDQNVAGELAERVVTYARGVGGAELLLLSGECELLLGRRFRGQLHLVGAASDHDDGASRCERLDRLEDVARGAVSRRARGGPSASRT